MRNRRKNKATELRLNLWKVKNKKLKRSISIVNWVRMFAIIFKLVLKVRMSEIEHRLIWLQLQKLKWRWQPTILNFSQLYRKVRGISTKLNPTRFQYRRFSKLRLTARRATCYWNSQQRHHHVWWHSNATSTTEAWLIQISEFKTSAKKWKLS